MAELLVGVKQYKIFKCLYCGRYILTNADKMVTCPHCHSILNVKKLIKRDRLVYSSDSWIDASLYLQDLMKTESRLKPANVIELLYGGGFRR